MPFSVRFPLGPPELEDLLVLDTPEMSWNNTLPRAAALTAWIELFIVASLPQPGVVCSSAYVAFYLALAMQSRPLMIGFNGNGTGCTQSRTSATLSDPTMAWQGALRGLMQEGCMMKTKAPMMALLQYALW
mmetsp:Transcript_29311/g.67477  ORF Transcript_29311/g.67477 Transcript_29311/m.67477 type:complete len:131 (+) Transcript_29311:223-615(+)